MDWDTIIPLLIGAAIALVSSIALELIRDWLRGNSEETTQIRDLQASMLALSIRMTSVQSELALPGWAKVARFSAILRAYQDLAGSYSQIAAAATHLRTKDAREIAQSMRKAPFPDFNGKPDVFAKKTQEFSAQLVDASDKLGEIVRKRRS